MTCERLIASPPLAPEMGEWPSASEQIDAIIRRTWGLHCAGEVSWDGAGVLHDALNGLRENFANFRETRGRPQ